jgi:hypothetical protein
MATPNGGKPLKRDILARDVPEELYKKIVEMHSAALLAGDRKSLGTILIELALKGMQEK